MNIIKASEGDSLKITLEGRLDTTTAPQLEASLKESLAGVKSLAFDFSSLVYLSSAGLRVILATLKIVKKQGGKMVIRNVNDTIMEVFEITGFADILTIEN